MKMRWIAAVSLISLVVVVALMLPLSFAKAEEPEEHPIKITKESNCSKSGCHPKIETHRGKRCVYCHWYEGDWVADPGKFKYGKCQRCHKEKVENFKNSLHYTLAGMKKVFEGDVGKDFDLSWPDDILQGKVKPNCISCKNQGVSTETGKIVSQSFTCGSPTNNRGEEAPCHTHSRKEKGEKEGEGPLAPSSLIPPKPEEEIEVCTTCHEHASGTNYKGYRLSGKKGPYADVHYKAGMTCTDCHSSQEIHGTGEKVQSMWKAVKVRCPDCHKKGKKVSIEQENKTITAPVWKGEKKAHQIHKGKLDCSACHGGWYEGCTCHLETGEYGENPLQFRLGRSPNGKVVPFRYQINIYGDKKTTVWHRMQPHTITKKNVKDCKFCHENRKVMIPEDTGPNPTLLSSAGKGSFLSEERVEEANAAYSKEVKPPKVKPKLAERVEELSGRVKELTNRVEKLSNKVERLEAKPPVKVSSPGWLISISIAAMIIAVVSIVLVVSYRRR